MDGNSVVGVALGSSIGDFVICFCIGIRIGLVIGLLVVVKLGAPVRGISVVGDELTSGGRCIGATCGLREGAFVGIFAGRCVGRDVA